MLLNIPHGSGMLLNVTVDEAAAKGVSTAEIEAAVASKTAVMDRDTKRSAINQTAGDTLSLLGTASDAATIAVLAGAAIMSALEETTSYAAFRTKAYDAMSAISGEHDPVDIANAFLAKVAAGTIRLPALEKGIVTVLAEVEARSNAVAQALQPLPPA